MRRAVWQQGVAFQDCVASNARHKGKTACQTPALRDETLQDAFVMAINRTLHKKDEIIRICEATMEKRCDIQPLKEEQKKLQAELEVTRGLMERLITLNATTVMDQDEYNRQFAEYEARYNEIRQRIADAESEQKQRVGKRGKLASTETAEKSRDHFQL